MDYKNNFFDESNIPDYAMQPAKREEAKPVFDAAVYDQLYRSLSGRQESPEERTPAPGPHPAGPAGVPDAVLTGAPPAAPFPTAREQSYIAPSPFQEIAAAPVEPIKPANVTEAPFIMPETVAASAPFPAAPSQEPPAVIAPIAADEPAPQAAPASAMDPVPAPQPSSEPVQVPEAEAPEAPVASAQGEEPPLEEPAESVSAAIPEAKEDSAPQAKPEAAGDAEAIEVSAALEIEDTGDQPRILDAALEVDTDSAVACDPAAEGEDETPQAAAELEEPAVLSKETTAAKTPAPGAPLKIMPVGNDLMSRNVKFTDFRALPVIRITVEEDTLVPDVKPDLDSVLFMEGKCRLAENTFTVGQSGMKELRVSGGLDVQTLYIRSRSEGEEPLIAMESHLQFKEDVPVTAAPGGELTVSPLLESLSHEVINERKFRIRAVIALHFREYRPTQLDLFEGIRGEETQLLQETVPLTDVALRKKESVEIAEDLKLREGAGEIGEILTYRVDVAENHKQINQDKAVISGAASVNVMYRTVGTEEAPSKPEFFRGKMEFTQFIRIKEGELNETPAGSRTAFQVRSLSVKPKEGEDGLQNMLSISMDVETELELYRDREVSVVTDLYHPDKEMKYDRSQVEMFHLVGNGLTEVGAREILNIPENKGSADQILFVSGVPVIDQTFIEQGKSQAEGNIRARVVCLSAEEGAVPFSMELLVPFRASVDVPGIRPDMESQVEVALKDLWFEKINNRQVEINAGLSVSASVYAREECSLIQNVSFLEEAEAVERPSIVVYIARDGDNLWKIAKKYRTPLEQLREVNGIAPGGSLKAGDRIMVVK